MHMFGTFANDDPASTERNVVGTSGDDDLRGTQRKDTFHLAQGGDDTARGRGGTDIFEMGSAFTAADSLDGGADFDAVEVFETSATTIVFTATTLIDVELLKLTGGGSFDLTSDDANVAAGATLQVRVEPTTDLVFDGSAELDGSFHLRGASGSDFLTGGAGTDRLGGQGGDDALVGRGGDDLIRGGLGADDIRPRKGADTLAYTSGADSSSTTHDTVVKLDANEDRFDVDLAVTNVVTKSGTLNTATFDSDMGTAINDWTGAVVLTVTGGDLIGHTFLVIDANGNVSYDAGTDHVIDITGYSGTLDAADFI
jgi:hypothetical protein